MAVPRTYEHFGLHQVVASGALKNGDNNTHAELHRLDPQGTAISASHSRLPERDHNGKMLDNARAMAEGAPALHVEGLTEDKETLPEPSTLEEVMSDPDNGVAVLVSVKTEQAKPSA